MSYPDQVPAMSASQVVDDLKLRLANLAAEAPEQVRYLRSIGRVSVDELALEFDDAMRLTWIPLEAGVITDQQLAGARLVDQILHTLSGRENAEKWTEDSLEHAEEWVRVRIAAKEALRALL